MRETIVCILLIILGISVICITIDELRTNYEFRKSMKKMYYKEDDK